ncbi:MAG: hypothetical protein GY756_13875 [bacterium]|nr:hypothetical protein [bacterium]
MKKTLTILIILFASLNSYSQVSEYAEVAITLGEKWKVGKQEYNIKQTVITGNRLYTIHVLVDYKPEMDNKNKTIAEEIVRYAIENGYLKNALKYNSISEQFSIFDTIVGVAFIENNETLNNMSGCRFVIKKEDLKDIEENEIPLPKSFTESKRKELISKIEKTIESRYFEDLIDLYSPNALNDINVEQAKLKITQDFSLSKEISIKPDTFSVYIGKKGVNGYHFLIPIEIVPIANENYLINAFIRVQIIDTKPEFQIYGILLNIPNAKDWNTYVQVGDITVPIMQR